MEIPKFLIERYQFWKENTFKDYKDIYQQASKTPQKPIAMIITCCDSRILENTIFGGSVGDYFIHRNIANIVPPYSQLTEHSGTIAAIEFGVTALNIKNIIIIGHSGCGGIKNGYHMCHENNFDDNSSISNWLKLLKPVYDNISGEGKDEKVKYMEKESIIVSLENLSKYPFINTEVKSGEIMLYGVWNDIGSGSIETYDFEKKKFDLI